MNIINDILSWNKQLGFLDKGYDEKAEAAYQVEEALENFNTITLANALGTSRTSPKELSRLIVSLLMPKRTTTIVDKIDKHIDSIYFDIGSLGKLGLSDNNIMAILNIVHDANLQKLNAPVDSKGKATKPKDFMPPEDKIEEYLKLVGKYNGQ